MSLPGWLKALLPGETAVAWERIAPLVPTEAYLGGGTALAVHLRHRPSRDLDFFFHEATVDLDRVAERLRTHGRFAVTQRTPGTLSGLFDETRIQFLRAGLERPERRLEPTSIVGALRVAGLGDLLAMKLNAVAGRAQLRDYFDLMTIERRGGRTIEEGLGLFLARYQPTHEDSAITPILLALGHFDDVGDDPFLPVERAAIVRYWQRRQPEIVKALERYGVTRPVP
ncbi:MAG: nucleotidyl transferase AbiEii/AbiGii toxin family protein [Acidobacteria bacterium]|nr:nucleotidyl transferase AbiEii/AbiGii toxin family protein [Acidobacteriota bacterium]